MCRGFLVLGSLGMQRGGNGGCGVSTTLLQLTTSADEPSSVYAYATERPTCITPSPPEGRRGSPVFCSIATQPPLSLGAHSTGQPLGVAAAGKRQADAVERRTC
jgi:hypothetical protein